MLTENYVSFFLQCNFELSTIYKFVLTHFEYISIGATITATPGAK